PREGTSPSTPPPPPLGGVVGKHVALALLDNLAGVTQDVMGELMGQGEAHVAVGEIAAHQDESAQSAVDAQPVSIGSEWRQRHVHREVLLYKSSQIPKRVTAQIKLPASKRCQFSPL